MNISWKQGVSGDFATSSNWNPAAVPGPLDDATIGAKGTYTVTSSVAETVDSLTIAKKSATVFITGASTFTMTNGGVNDGTILVDNASALNVGTTSESTTLANLGQIELGSAANGQFVVAGDASLQGNGKVILSDNPNNVIAGIGSVTLSTDNVISGAGKIGGSGFTLVNEVGGIIDATGVNPLHINPGTLIDNSGILESTNPDGLSNPGGLTIGSNGGPAITINNTPLGVIEAKGANTNVSFLYTPVTVVGGTLETRGANAVIHFSTNAEDFLDGTQPGNPVNIDGNVLVSGQTSLALMGTINNTGVITVNNEEDTNPWLIIHGNVTLQGGGDIILTSPPFTADAIFGGVLTNVDNVISGTGSICERSTFLGPDGVLINEAKGVIDADASTPLLLTGSGPDTNAGLVEATQTGTLLLENATIDNFLNTTNGTVEAGTNSTVGLENATIVDGLVTVKHGAIFEAELGSNTITGAVVTNAGTIGAEGANLSIIGDVTNTGTLDANNAILDISGAVSGGKATLEGTGEIVFGGPSAANVTFAAGNSDAILALGSAFTGTVSGLTTGDYIDLPNINFADDPTVNYSSKTHLLTVTDSVTDVTDTVKLVGPPAGTFTTQADSNGGTEVTDPPPPANMVAVSQGGDAFVFAPNLGENTTVNFNAHSETIDPPKSEFADFAALLAQHLQDGSNALAHDAADILHHTEAFTAQHAHDFLV